MKTLVKFFIAYRKNIFANLAFGLLLLSSSLLIFMMTVHFNDGNMIVSKENIFIFVIGVINLLFSYRKIVNTLDVFREAKLTEGIEKWNLGHNN
jgi:uncharacterized protein YhhL (DUF1145 family)